VSEMREQKPLDAGRDARHLFEIATSSRAKCFQLRFINARSPTTVMAAKTLVQAIGWGKVVRKRLSDSVERTLPWCIIQTWSQRRP